MNIKLVVSTTLILLVTTVSLPVLAQGQTATPPTQTLEAEKLDNIKKLLAITGSKALFEQVTTQLISAMKPQYPQVPQKFWDTFAAEINADEVINRIIPIYSKYFTNEDIQGLIAFYQTPLGRKSLAVLPQITVESLQVGQQYGTEVSKKVIDKLRAEGYIK